MHYSDLFLGDNVIFSSRIQLLVSKLGRSSRPSPRFLIVVGYLVVPSICPWLTNYQTAKAIHILVTNEQLQTHLERKIPLVTIKSLAMSNLRDDWLVGVPPLHALHNLTR